MKSSAPKSMKRCFTKRCGSSRRASAPVRTRPRCAAKWPAPARSCGSRRARAARAWVRFDRRCGATAARCTGRCRAITATSCRARCSWARCARRFPPRLRDGELKVVQAFNFADHKTKNAMGTLAKLEGGRTVLVVDNGENRNLALGVAQPQGRDAAAHQRRQCVTICWATRACCSAKRRRGNSRRRSQNDHL